MQEITCILELATKNAIATDKPAGNKHFVFPSQSGCHLCRLKDSVPINLAITNVNQHFQAYLLADCFPQLSMFIIYRKGPVTPLSPLTSNQVINIPVAPLGNRQLRTGEMRLVSKWVPALSEADHRK